MTNANDIKEIKDISNNHLMARVLLGLYDTSGSLQLQFITPYK
jgi:hypothetical protein